MPLFLIFLVVPIVEMLLLFKVADHIGGLNTVGLVVLTAVIGIQVLKQQGLATFTRANQRLESGEIPGQEILEGLLLAVGGAFLLTPGFITDTLGFILLIGPTRRLLARWLIRSGKIAMFTSRRGGSSFTFTRFSTRDVHRPQEHDIYEGEYTEERPPKSRLKDPDD
jgi:UPF0716 protein FxsA